MRAAGTITLLAALLAAPCIAVAQGAAAQSLPPPPYQSAAYGPAQPGGYGAAPMLDRYGGGTRYAAPTPAAYTPTAYGQSGYGPAVPAQAVPAQAAPAPSGGYLSWSGKGASPATAAPPMMEEPRRRGGLLSAIPWPWRRRTDPAAQPYAYPGAYTGAYPGASAGPTQGYTPAAQGWRPLYPQASPVQPPVQAQMQPPVQPYAAAQMQPPTQPQPQPAPTSIYDPVPAQAVPAQGAPTAPPSAPGQQASAGGPRFYSLHREYGIQPDAIPLPPQFFGPTADLSTPPADPQIRRTTSTGQTRTAAAPEASDAGQ